MLLHVSRSYRAVGLDPPLSHSQGTKRMLRLGASAKGNSFLGGSEPRHDLKDGFSLRAPPAEPSVESRTFAATPLARMWATNAPGCSEHAWSSCSTRESRKLL